MLNKLKLRLLSLFGIRPTFTDSELIILHSILLAYKDTTDKEYFNSAIQCMFPYMTSDQIAAHIEKIHKKTMYWE